MFFPGKKAHRLALTVLLLGLGRAASAQTLYETGFESPTFTAGTFAGQKGWERDGSGSQTAATIQSGVVRSGTQALQINAALDSESVYYWPALNYDTATHPNSLLSVSWDMYLSAAGTASPAWGITVADDQASEVGWLLVNGRTGPVTSLAKTLGHTMRCA